MIQKTRKRASIAAQNQSTASALPSEQNEHQPPCRTLSPYIRMPIRASLALFAAVERERQDYTWLPE